MFTDNEGSLGIFIKCRCENIVGMGYVECTIDLEDELNVTGCGICRTCAYGVQHRRCPFAPLRFVLDRQNLGRFVVLNLIHNSFQAVDAE